MLELWMPKPYAQVSKHRAGPHTQGVLQSGLRVYKSDPDGITLQWRVCSKTEHGKATAEGTLATGHLTWSETQALRDYLTGLLQENSPA